MSAYITTLRSVVDELIRERVQSMAVESTRWCDYSNNSKFEGITFCLPHWINYSIFDSCMKRFLADVKEANINKDKIDKFYDYEDIAFVFIKIQKLLKLNVVIIILELLFLMKSYIMKLKMNLNFLRKMHVNIYF